MKIKNKVQARERAKHILDGYVEGYKLLKRELCLDFEHDPDVIEFTDEEIENGDAYVSSYDIDIFKGNRMQMTRLVKFADFVGLPLKVFIREGESSFPYEISFVYKGIKFFEVLSEKDYKNYLKEGYIFEITSVEV